MKGIRSHLYLSATSTKPGFGKLILAKWNSFVRHVGNKHADHPDPSEASVTTKSLSQENGLKLVRSSKITLSTKIRCLLTN